MRRTLQNAPGSTIFLVFLMVMPSFGLGADRSTGAAVGGVAPEICFPLPDGERILQDLESLAPCREAVTAGEDALRAEEVRAQALEGRVAEQDRELTEARKLVEDTRKAGEQAAKVAAGPWYQKVLSVAKWGALFFLGGLVLGASK